ncbi:(2,3-dihydroxybenzoyl)adenylate synthase [Guyparkeria halophila]|uniref:(2,3-dihydroxybenzoyl)adenylate synthase n=1 Tax=Guyparkeria halophila TaxID=47960 RepID=A0ABZ0YYP9_9GAMM|nr:(2,3-dihydroxybenzoyl)adenylate synthase [Guyparkeria halophila]WQH16674.1 (2,3-dihydroxybenzoyl)adenylate synthase [Guyparkeria halophila]
MSVAFTCWPEALARRYRDAGYWRGQPLTDILDAHDPREADRDAIVCAERRFSYDQLIRLSRRLAASLVAAGLRPGQTVLVQMPNCAEFYLLFFALLRCGAVPVNALFSHNRRELLAFAEQIAPALLVLTDDHPAMRGRQGTALVDELRRYASGEARLLHFGDRALPVEKVLTDFRWEDGEPLDESECLNGFSPNPPDEVAFFQLSGGSTGLPKLIPRTHDDYGYSVRASAELCRLNVDTVFLCALPAPHNYSLSSPGTLGILHAGGVVVMARDPGPATCFELIDRHAVTMAALVPPALSLWLEAADSVRPPSLGSLSLLQVGGARLSPALAEQVPTRLGCRLQQVFGMAEGLVNYTRLDDDRWYVENTQGRPLSPADEIRVRDAEGRDVPPGEVGTLWARGPYTFRGYYRAEAHNAVAFDVEGFYCSGDLVRRTDSGYLVVVGREKDQINRGGEKIDALEIEDLLLGHPAIRQAALVAMPDEVLGERSCAFLVADARLRAVDVRRFLRREGVADFKLPDRVEFIDDLPRTAVGKIDKAALRRRICSAAAC